LGEICPTDIQGVSEPSPKPSPSATTEKPELIVDFGDLPATARAVRDLLAVSGILFDRGIPVRVVQPADGGPPIAERLTANRVVIEAHQLCRPVRPQGDNDFVPVTLPNRVAQLYLSLAGEWALPPLAGISTGAILAPDGKVQTVAGYDSASGLWCAGVPALSIPEHPSRCEAETALQRLRLTFCTFPFADARRQKSASLGPELVDLEQPPGLDESAFLAGLLTAVCRPHLWLAPGFLVRAPEISGAGTGKGLLVRSICAIAFGVRPRAFTKGGDRQELDKRLASDLIEAAPILFLDNVNGSLLRSDILASVLTERPVSVRPLGRTQMVALNSTAFIALTGNGLSVSEDLARRFIVCEFDARCEDPEQRKFEIGLLRRIEAHRAELLAAALTIWRWGRQHALAPGRPLGSFEQWSAWCRDPLLALGCSDPVERIDAVKSDDPHRRQIVQLFQTWHAHHADRPTTAADLTQPARDLIDPQGDDLLHLLTTAPVQVSRTPA
jgi:hypothetical protein